jgi:transposase-like protein
MTHEADFTTVVVAMDTFDRWRFAPEFKRERVEGTLQPGASVAGIALAHRINANQLFKCTDTTLRTGTHWPICRGRPYYR